MRAHDVSITICPPGCRCDCAIGGECEHEWDGPTAVIDMGYGPRGESGTCSRCGLTAMDHDLMVMP